MQVDGRTMVGPEQSLMRIMYRCRAQGGHGRLGERLGGVNERAERKALREDSRKKSTAKRERQAASDGSGRNVEVSISTLMCRIYSRSMLPPWSTRARGLGDCAFLALVFVFLSELHDHRLSHQAYPSNAISGDRRSGPE